MSKEQTTGRVMAGKHTPGKIAVTYWSKRESALTTADGKTHFCGPGLPGDMERLAALWNACEGIPNPSAIREVVEALRLIQKTMDGYRSQMRFCDVEAIGYFREFDRRVDASGFRAALAKLEGRS